jgi:hypothetical protein
MGEIKKKTFTKKSRKKIKKNQIKKHNTINLNWMIKLKTTKFFTKWPRIKIRNPNNKDYIQEYNIQ